MARSRQIIVGDWGTENQCYDTLPVHHRLKYWDKHFKHWYWGLDVPP